MKNTQPNQVKIGSFLITALFIIVGIVTLYDTLSYTDIDSKVFPRAAAIVLIICATVSLIMELLKPAESEGFGVGIWWRRVLLVITMLLCCLAMPYIGFLFSAMIAFAGAMIAAMHDQWTTKGLLVYWSSGVLIMVAFYALFRFTLLVPLP